jgi:hypothetical protein
MLTDKVFGQRSKQRTQHLPKVAPEAAVKPNFTINLQQFAIDVEASLHKQLWMVLGLSADRVEYNSDKVCVTSLFVHCQVCRHDNMRDQSL